MIAQEQQEETARTLRYPISASGASTELPAPTASAFLQWNATADALVNAVIPDPSTLIKATSAEAQAGVEDTHFMTPAKTAEAINALSPALTKASQSVAEAATNDTAYMTPLQVKNQVQKSGAVSIPSNNIDFSNEKITFFATTATAQSIPNATDTKIAYGTEAFDVGGYYDPTTYRFSPLISGKYSVTASIDFPSPDATNQYGSIYIFKNGSPVLRFNRNEKAGGANDFCLSVNGIVSMNGTTDYLEVFVYQSNTSASAKSLDTNATINYFGAFKVA
ncbi:hypothetical protein EKI60_06395 [Candidatus Saccharibacteria bacterium]|nr:MAG: hypothetical protein EKI60_06395 [Candidatus Saccharibacteria bacterium]